MSWDYEVLFDVQERTELERAGMEWWKEFACGIRTGRMGYRTVTTKAGRRLEAEIYPVFGREQERMARRARQNLTPEKMRRVNEERARRHLIQLMDANFDEKDIHLTLTYVNPPTFEQAQKDVRNFLNRVKRRRKKAGLEELKYIYAIEDNEDGEKKRIHCHVIMSGAPDLYEYRRMLEELWAKGYANADRLQPGMDGLEAVARYISKQNRSRSRRKWTSSKNLKKPKVRRSDTKMSNARVKRLARGFEAEAKEIMEKIYPGYDHVRTVVRYSDVVDGAYIRVLMRKRE